MLDSYYYKLNPPNTNPIITRIKIIKYITFHTFEQFFAKLQATINEIIVNVTSAAKVRIPNPPPTYDNI